MKKAIIIIALLAVMPFASAEIEERAVEPYAPPLNGFGYFLKITVPELFGQARTIWNHDARISYQLELLEKRQIEIEYLLSKINETENKARYEQMLSQIEKKYEQSLKRLEHFASLVRSDKQQKVSQILANKERKLNEISAPGMEKAMQALIALKEKLKAQPVATDMDSNIALDDSIA